MSKDYREKGKYITVDGLKTYATGPADAKLGILIVYDIFGFFPQTLQGADILSGLHHEANSTHRRYRVFMPDFFEGSPADISWYPPNTEEKGKKLGEFFKTTAAPPKTVAKMATVMEELKSKNSNIEEWAVLGFCWGGKIVNLVSQSGTPFRAAATAHPAMVDPNDATKVTIPMLMIPSKDENKEDVDKYEQNLSVPHSIEWFHDQIHGFMAARSNLDDENVRSAYEKAYQIVGNWYTEHL